MFCTKRHEHEWEIVKKGEYNKVGAFFNGVISYCHCGETKCEDYVSNFKDAGYSLEEYLVMAHKKYDERRIQS